MKLGVWLAFQNLQEVLKFKMVAVIQNYDFRIAAISFLFSIQFW